MATYNPYDAISKIFGYKQDWTKYNQNGEESKKNKAAGDAQAYYNQLRKNGYSELADEMSQAGLAEAEKIKNRYAKTGMTAVRPYLKTLGKQYGFTDADIDKNLSYDDDTGEITFGGMKLGKPFSVVSGVSYMPEDQIGQFMKEYAKNTGTGTVSSAQYQTGMDKAQSMNQQLFDTQLSDHERMNSMAAENNEYIKNHNPYETAIGKSIMEGFTKQGDRSAGNAMADSASSNGGNLDSFAAAEGARQRAAFEQLGKQAVLEDFNVRLNHVNDVFNNLGIYNQNQYASMGDTVSRETAISQQVFDNDQTGKNNEVSRDTAVSGITGYIPSKYEIDTNPFFKDGKLIDENTDYQAVIDSATKQLETETDPNQIAVLQATVRAANQARNYKIQNNIGKYGKYAGTMKAVSPEENADMRKTRAQISSAEKIAADNNAADYATQKMVTDAEVQMNNANNNAALTEAAMKSSSASTAANNAAAGKPTLTASQAVSAIKNGEKSQTVIDAYNYYYGTDYTVDHPPVIGSSEKTEAKQPTNTGENKAGNKTGSGSLLPEFKPLTTSKLSDSDVKSWVSRFNNYANSQYGAVAIEANGGTYKVKPEYREKIVKDILQDKELSSEQKQYLITVKLGIDPGVIDDVVRDPHYK